MIRQILVPLDGSTLAESILPVVQEFVHLTGATLTLLRIIEPVEPLVEVVELHHYVEQELRHRTSREQEAQRYLDSLTDRLRASGLVIQTRITHGYPAETIIQLGPEYDLIAMATHGRGGLGRWVYGSVTDKVLRGATVPVLLIRAQAEGLKSTGRPRRILVPLDGSELAETVLPLATSLAHRAGASVILHRSIGWAYELSSLDAFDLGANAASLAALAEDEARRQLAEVGAALKADGIQVIPDLRLDPAAEGILAGASECAADLIIMSTHGRGGLGRWVYGSVADKVLRGAMVPILLVRAGTTVAALPEAQLPATAGR